MISIYAANTANLPDPKECPEVMDGLSEERKKKILRFIHAKDRKQSLGAGLLLQHVLFLYGKDQESIKYGKNGKPEVEDICFNLSHSDHIVVCAVSSESVGCDVEKIENLKEKVADRFFCKSEIAYLNSFSGEEQEKEFYRLWTMKESYIKMTGEGMRLPLDQFEIVFDENVKVIRDGKICACHIKEYEISGYKLTVCAKDTEFAETVEFIKI